MKLQSKQKNIIVIEIILLIVGIILLIGVGGKKPEPVSSISQTEIKESLTETEKNLSNIKSEYDNKLSHILISDKEKELNSIKSGLSPDLEEVQLMEMKGNLDNINLEITKYTPRLKKAEKYEKMYLEQKARLTKFEEENSKSINNSKKTRAAIEKIKSKFEEIQSLIDKISNIDDYSYYDEISTKNYEVKSLIDSLDQDLKNEIAAIKQAAAEKKKREEQARLEAESKDDVEYDTPSSFDYIPQPQPQPQPKEKKVVKTRQAELVRSPTSSELRYPTKFYGGKICMIEVVIDKLGNVSSTKVSQSSGNTELDDYCRDLAKKYYKFKPAVKVYDDGSEEKVESTSILPFKPPKQK